MSEALATPRWRRSERCANGACVEVAIVDGEVLVRDSKLTDSPILRLRADAWSAFLTDLRAAGNRPTPR